MRTKRIKSRTGLTALLAAGLASVWLLGMGLLTRLGAEYHFELLDADQRTAIENIALRGRLSELVTEEHFLEEIKTDPGLYHWWMLESLRGTSGLYSKYPDSMVTRMYAEYYAKDESCALTQEEFQEVAVLADSLTRKCRWDKIFLIAPHGVYVDDHERFMAHSGMKERKELFDILCKNIKDSGNWDKVVLLTGDYYENFMAVVQYVNEVMAR